jgi:hypothetical protein
LPTLQLSIAVKPKVKFSETNIMLIKKQKNTPYPFKSESSGDKKNQQIICQTNINLWLDSYWGLSK